MGAELMARVRVSDFHPSYTARGKSPDFGTFGQFMVSEQIEDPLREAAGDIIEIAKTLVPPSADTRDGHYRDKFGVQAGKLRMVVGKTFPNRRAIVRVTNSAKNAVPLEFGSGKEAEGTSGTSPRPQGGWNTARRPLYRAGRKIGRPFQKGQM